MKPLLETPSPGLPNAGQTRSDAELGAYIRNSIIRAALALLALAVVLGTVGVIFQAELLAVTQAIADVLGLFGLLAILFVSDSVFSPIPPDAVLIVIANSELSTSWPILIPFIGLLSVLAGGLGLFFGRSLRHTRFARRLVGGFSTKSADLVARYGRWGIALAALTPVPFSISCWIGGMLGMDARAYFSVAWLRIPRFVGYYVVIARADDWLRLIL